MALLSFVVVAVMLLMTLTRADFTIYLTHGRLALPSGERTPHNAAFFLANTCTPGCDYLMSVDEVRPTDDIHSGTQTIRLGFDTNVLLNVVEFRVSAIGHYSRPSKQTDRYRRCIDT